MKPVELELLLGLSDNMIADLFTTKQGRKNMLCPGCAKKATAKMPIEIWCEHTRFTNELSGKEILGLLRSLISKRHKTPASDIRINIVYVKSKGGFRSGEVQYSREKYTTHNILIHWDDLTKHDKLTILGEEITKEYSTR